ncbi:S-layer homology domain-containing protein [Cohnella soli]|uniref:S-layer homology domain-containing protein n=1 Tax=Cohnella soli TaxID=425005 RepID=A0ABW0HWK0_9BACL
MKKLLSLLLSLTLVIPAWTFSASASDGDTIQVDYAWENADFSEGLTGWDNNNSNGATDKIRAEQVLVLEPGAAVWQPIDIGNGGPSVGDTVYAKVRATLSSDVTRDDNVLVRLVAGSELAEVNSLAGVQREVPVEVTSSVKQSGGKIPAGQQKLWIEMHNDTQGTIEVSRVEAWGIDADNNVKSYTVSNGDFSQPLNGNWEHNDKVGLSSYAILEPGAAAWRSLPVGNVPASPQAGDKVGVKASLFVPSAVNRTDSVFVRVNDGHNTLRDVDNIADTPRGKWFSAEGRIISAGGTIGADSTELWIELHNDTNVPVRLKGLALTAERSAASIYDLNRDGVVDEADAAWLSERIAGGTFDPRGDFDGDGQLTAKDLVYFKKYGLRQTNVFYLNLNHFNFMNENVTIDGEPMMITHLYSEPIDRSDPSKGYAWVGDPQEGIAAVDDVSRAVIAYAEHYRLYGDANSYDKIKRGLAFLMWMQHADGDFDNFVAEEPDGTIHPKDSASSQKSFSWWAVRSYEAFAMALPLLKADDDALAGRVKDRLALCLKRLKEKTDPNYGQYVEVNGIKTAKWLLYGDTWLTSLAIDALAVHYKIAGSDSAKADIRESVRRLGEAVSMAKFGDYRDFPYGGYMHLYAGAPGIYNWDEWSSIQVRAMAYAGRIAGQPAWIEAAEHAADSFLSDLLISGRAETMHPNKKPYPQINYGTASYVDNLLALYEVTGKAKYAELAGIAASWWTGNNAIGLPMFNESQGYAYDGLFETEANINSGAESVDEAIRVLSRVLDNPIASKNLYARTAAAKPAMTVEAEALYQRAAPPDERMSFPNGDLNNPNAALVKQGADSGTDEAKIYEDAQALTGEREVYSGWTGSKALFVAATGYNNIRLFNGSWIKTELPVGGDNGNFKAGDSVKLEFAARVEFDTSLKAEVYAVLDNGSRVRVADANGMKYHPRTWYAGASSVKSTPVAKIPEGTTKLEIRFDVVSSKNPPQEGYAMVTEGKLYKMSVPEIRYSNTDLSGSSYVQMPPGQKKDFDIQVREAGTYDVMLSYIANPQAKVNIGFGSLASKTVSLKGSTSDAVQIARVDTVELPAGTVSLHLENPDAAVPADIDALILYPLSSYATYTLPGGEAVKVLRDSLTGTLAVGTAGQVDDRHTIRLEPHSAAAAAGSALNVSGDVRKADGTPAVNENVTVSAFGGNVVAKTNAEGRFAASLDIPSQTEAGAYRLKVSTALGEASTGIAVVRPSDGGSGEGTQATGNPDLEGVLEVTKAHLHSREKGGLLIAIPESANVIRIPQAIFEDIQSDPVELSGAEFGLTIPPEVLADLAKKATAAGMKNWSVSFEIVKIEEPAANDLLAKLDPSVQVKLTLGNSLYEFKLSIAQPNGKSLEAGLFAKPITLSLKLGGNVNPAWSGIYYFGDQGLEYVKGKSSSGFMTASVSHFSKYGVLEYVKTFLDVPSSHWAYDQVTALAARHIVNGKSERLFGKDAPVTRAEMASLLVRAFGIEGAGAMEKTFSDVNAGSWYATDVAAAAAAGIVTGRTLERFDPGSAITRAEAAAMLMRAADRQAVKLPSGAAALNQFADEAKIPALFTDALERSVGAGLLKGDASQRLRPNDALTRAEAAVVLARLLKMSETE